MPSARRKQVAFDVTSRWKPDIESTWVALMRKLTLVDDDLAFLQSRVSSLYFGREKPESLSKEMWKLSNSLAVVKLFTEVGKHFETIARDHPEQFAGSCENPDMEIAELLDGAHPSKVQSAFFDLASRLFPETTTANDREYQIGLCPLGTLSSQSFWPAEDTLVKLHVIKLETAYGEAKELWEHLRPILLELPLAPANASPAEVNRTQRLPDAYSLISAAMRSVSNLTAGSQSAEMSLVTGRSISADDGSIASITDTLFCPCNTLTLADQSVTYYSIASEQEVATYLARLRYLIEETRSSDTGNFSMVYAPRCSSSKDC